MISKIESMAKAQLKLYWGKNHVAGHLYSACFVASEIMKTGYECGVELCFPKYCIT